MVCVISQTTNITTKILAEVNQDVDELRPITVFFFFKQSYYKLFVAQAQFSGMCCFNVLDFYNIAYGQTELYKERKTSQVTLNG